LVLNYEQFYEGFIGTYNREFFIFVRKDVKKKDAKEGNVREKNTT